MDKVGAPPYWGLVNIDPQDSPAQRVYFGRKARDDDERDRLTPGSFAEGLTIQAKWGPGLVALTAIGYKPIPGEPGYTTDEAEVLGVTMSGWLREEINRATSVENDSVTIYTIGPKMDPSLSALSAVRAELQQAAGLAEFARDRQALLAATELSDAALLRDRLRQIGTGASGLRADFYLAMLSPLP